jgi:hypothetical protein
MIRTVFALGAVATLLTASEAWAQATPEADDNHYSFHRVEDGYLRLDLHSGEISLCNRRATGWACEVVPDDRRALRDENALLHAENAALKKELLDHGLSLPSGIVADPPVADSSNRDNRVASIPKIERVKILVGKMWQRLVEMIANLRRGVLKQT